MTIYEQLERAQKSIQYINSIIGQQMEEWERKEFNAVLADSIQTEKEMLIAIEEYEAEYK